LLSVSHYNYCSDVVKDLSVEDKDLWSEDEDKDLRLENQDKDLKSKDLKDEDLWSEDED